MAHKRSSSHLNDPASPPKKIPRTRSETILVANDALVSANARIAELECQIQDLHAFINDKGLLREVPPSIREQILSGPDAAETLAEQIRDAACEVGDRLCTQTESPRRTRVSSDDMSKAMMPFLDEVRDLRELPESTAIAFDLVVTLARCSYGTMDYGGCGDGDRPSDPEIDDLLVELATERKKIDPLWNFSWVLRELRERAQYLAEYYIEDFCVQTIELLSAWEEDLPATEKSTQRH